MADLLELSAYGFDLCVAPLAGGGIARLDWHGKPVVPWQRVTHWAFRPFR
jgi:hypothetical protein